MPRTWNAVLMINVASVDYLKIECRCWHPSMYLLLFIFFFILFSVLSPSSSLSIVVQVVWCTWLHTNSDCARRVPTFELVNKCLVEAALDNFDRTVNDNRATVTMLFRYLWSLNVNKCVLYQAEAQKLIYCQNLPKYGQGTELEGDLDFKSSGLLLHLY